MTLKKNKKKWLQLKEISRLKFKELINKFMKKKLKMKD